MREVQKKKEMFYVWQKKFLQKHEHMKEIGQRLLTMKLLEEFIDENLDYLYENRTKDIVDILVEGSACTGNNDKIAYSYRQRDHFKAKSQSINFDRTFRQDPFLLMQQFAPSTDSRREYKA